MIVQIPYLQPVYPVEHGLENSRSSYSSAKSCCRGRVYLWVVDCWFADDCSVDWSTDWWIDSDWSVWLVDWSSSQYPSAVMRILPWSRSRLTYPNVTPIGDNSIERNSSESRSNQMRSIDGVFFTCFCALRRRGPNTAIGWTDFIASVPQHRSDL